MSEYNKVSEELIIDEVIRNGGDLRVMTSTEIHAEDLFIERGCDNCKSAIEHSNGRRMLVRRDLLRNDWHIVDTYPNNVTPDSRLPICQKYAKKNLSAPQVHIERALAELDKAMWSDPDNVDNNYIMDVMDRLRNTSEH